MADHVCREEDGVLLGAPSLYGRIYAYGRSQSHPLPVFVQPEFPTFVDGEDPNLKVTLTVWEI